MFSIGLSFGRPKSLRAPHLTFTSRSAVLFICIKSGSISRSSFSEDTEKTLLPETNGKSYNGQDYKSTAYQRGENINNEWYDLSNTELMDSRVSDAKDNEARRLQFIYLEAVG